jgi:hypothetical protein
MADPIETRARELARKWKRGPCAECHHDHDDECEVHHKHDGYCRCERYVPGQAYVEGLADALRERERAGLGQAVATAERHVAGLADAVRNGSTEAARSRAEHCHLAVLSLLDDLRALPASPPSDPAPGTRADDYGPGRCDQCGWTLAESADKGCVSGNCAYRPPDHSPEAQRIRERREALAKEDDPPPQRPEAAPAPTCKGHPCGMSLFDAQRYELDHRDCWTWKQKLPNVYDHDGRLYCSPECLERAAPQAEPRDEGAELLAGMPGDFLAAVRADMAAEGVTNRAPAPRPAGEVRPYPGGVSPTGQRCSERCELFPLCSHGAGEARAGEGTACPNCRGCVLPCCCSLCGGTGVVKPAGTAKAEGTPEDQPGAGEKGGG